MKLSRRKRRIEAERLKRRQPMTGKTEADLEADLQKIRAHVEHQMKIWRRVEQRGGLYAHVKPERKTLWMRVKAWWTGVGTTSAQRRLPNTAGSRYTG